MSPLRPIESTLFDYIFVGGVPRGTTEAELRAAFSLAGVVVGDIEFVLDRVTGLPRGFAFVALRGRTDNPGVGLALNDLPAATLGGRVLDIQGVPRSRRRWTHS